MLMNDAERNKGVYWSGSQMEVHSESCTMQDALKDVEFKYTASRTVLASSGRILPSDFIDNSFR